ncbi:hypothetical protein L0Y69_00060 [bacterium]|nr:hypothetical protein [bacterium]
MNDAKIEFTKLPQSEIELMGEIPADVFETFRPRAVKKLSEALTIEGFRKGHIPENIITAQIGETGILEEMAELALAEHYPKILAEGVDGEKIEAIGRPAITLTKLARGNPLGFKIRTAVLPTITLPDYEKIAKEKPGKKETVDVSDEEVEKAILKLRELRAGKDPLPASPSKEVEGQEDKELPPVDDAFAQSVGEFKSLDELKTKVRENILKEKEHRAKSKKRAEILEQIVDKTGGEIPDILTQSELHTMLQQFKTDVAAMGVTFDEYLKHAKKTEDELRKEWVPDAEKRVKTNFVLKLIAKEKNITPDTEAVEKEVAHLLKHYTDADKERTKAYVESIFTNEKVMEFLEKE